MQAKSMPLKKFVNNLKILRLLRVLTPFSKSNHLHPLLLDNQLNFFPFFRHLSPDECQTKSLEMSFLLAIFKIWYEKI